ncbi:MAG: hypothetical protein ABW185_04335 [Sedimenticola sp.]
MASNEITDTASGDTGTRLPPPDACGLDEGLITEDQLRQRYSMGDHRQRETVTMSRQELDDLVGEIKILRNQIETRDAIIHDRNTEIEKERQSNRYGEDSRECERTPVSSIVRDRMTPRRQEERAVSPVQISHCEARDTENRHGKQKPKQPATYSGPTGWREYLIHFEMVAEFNRWNDATKAFELALCLRNDAQVTLSDLTPNERKRYRTLVAALSSRFEPEDQSELYRSELKNRSRRRDEQLTELAQDIKRLVRLAYPNTGSDVRSTLARDAFEDALCDPDMEWAVHQGKPASVEAAVKLALEYEAFQSSRKKTGRYPRAQLRVQLEEGIENNTNGQHVMSSGNRRNNLQRKRCNFCGRNGHWEKDCYSKRNFERIDEPRFTNTSYNNRTYQNSGNGQ